MTKESEEDASERARKEGSSSEKEKEPLRVTTMAAAVNDGRRPKIGQISVNFRAQNFSGARDACVVRRVT